METLVCKFLLNTSSLITYIHKICIYKAVDGIPVLYSMAICEPLEQVLQNGLNER